MLYKEGRKNIQNESLIKPSKVDTRVTITKKKCTRHYPKHTYIYIQ